MAARETALIRTDAQLLAPLAELVERAREYAADSRATSTRKAYLTDFAQFEGWCAGQGLVASPATAATVAVYLTSLAERGKKPSTIERALAGIAWAQRSRGHQWPKGNPAITAVMNGIRRRLGAAPTQKAPVIDLELASYVATLGEDLVGLRDRALLTLGWFGAFRRSELVALTVADVAAVREGLVVHVRRSKGDQEAKGAEKGIPYASNPSLCPVRALVAWLAAAQITEGPIFRAIDQHGHVSAAALSDKSVSLVVKRAAERAGLDPKIVGGHSLRAGFATTAAKKGKSLDAIMRQTLHKSEKVARGYIRHAKLFDDNAAIGLA
jgi:site-specific recombinase XerD